MGQESHGEPELRGEREFRGGPYIPPDGSCEKWYPSQQLKLTHLITSTEGDYVVRNVGSATATRSAAATITVVREPCMPSGAGPAGICELYGICNYVNCMMGDDEVLGLRVWRAQQWWPTCP
jgi:hypothetical protein